MSELNKAIQKGLDEVTKQLGICNNPVKSSMEVSNRELRRALEAMKGILTAMFSPLRTWYFTFSTASQNRNCYCAITAENEKEARDIMDGRFGAGKWCIQYETIKQAGVYKYNLEEIK